MGTKLTGRVSMEPQIGIRGRGQNTGKGESIEIKFQWSPR